MKIRLAFALFVLTALILACSNTFPFIWEEERRYSGTTIMNLDVSPPSGTEDFNLDVTYEVFYVPEKTIPAIDCIYTAPDGTTADIGSIDMLRHIGNQTVETFTEVMPFFVPVKGDGSQAGIYIANCRTENNSSTQSTTFEVVKEEKGKPVLTVTNSPVTYSGSPQTAVIQSAILPDGVVPGAIMNVLYNGSTTVPVNAGTYTVTADFTPEDADSYFTLTAAPAGNFVIGKATPSLSVSNSPVTYDGAPHAAAVSASVPGSVSNVLTGGAASQTDAGSYAVTANFTPSDTTNYTSLTAAPAGDFIIKEASPMALTGGSSSSIMPGLDSSVPGAGSYAAEVTNLCIPEVTIGGDGTIRGSVSNPAYPASLVERVNLTTMVIGQMDPAGKVIFTYEVSEIGKSKWDLAGQHGGRILSADGKASGTADFSYSCKSGAENLLVVPLAASGCLFGNDPLDV